MNPCFMNAKGALRFVCSPAIATFDHTCQVTVIRWSSTYCSQYVMSVGMIVKAVPKGLDSPLVSPIGVVIAPIVVGDPQEW